jgi:hypothetical protein
VQLTVLQTNTQRADGQIIILALQLGGFVSGTIIDLVCGMFKERI